MTDPDESKSASPSGKQSGWTSQLGVVIRTGAFAAVFSAVGYTAANVFLRAAADVSPVWVSAIKAVWTVLIFGPWLLWLGFRGKRVLPSLPVCLMLIAASVFCQLAGNLAFQAALGMIGLAMIVPLTMGSMLIFGGLFGRLFLGERVSVTTAIAIGLMIVSISMISWGASGADSPNNSASSDQSSRESLSREGGQAMGDDKTLQISSDSILACCLGCLAGIAYAVLGIAVRIGARDRGPLITPMVIVGISGVLVLVPLGTWSVGLQTLWEYPPNIWLYMSLAGIANGVAFLALSRSLKMIPVAFVNSINASQVAMAAIAGLVIFGERLSAWAGAGIVMTIAAFVLLNLTGKRRQAEIANRKKSPAGPLETAESRSKFPHDTKTRLDPLDSNASGTKECDEIVTVE